MHRAARSCLGVMCFAARSAATRLREHDQTNAPNHPSHAQRFSTCRDSEPFGCAVLRGRHDLIHCRARPAAPAAQKPPKPPQTCPPHTSRRTRRTLHGGRSHPPRKSRPSRRTQAAIPAAPPAAHTMPHAPRTSAHAAQWRAQAVRATFMPPHTPQPCHPRNPPAATVGTTSPTTGWVNMATERSYTPCSASN